MTQYSLRETIDSRPMSRYQWFVVALATALMGLDGYDVQAMAFTANPVSEALELSGTQLGLLLSGGLIGMAIGAIWVGPFADRFGRRRMLMIAMIINAAGLFLSATASSMPELMIWRVITGLGVGGILTSGTVLVSEYSNAKHRGLCMSIYAAGYPVGATLGGLAAIPLIGTLGWQSVFVLGGLVTVVAVVFVGLKMPESLDFLAARSVSTQASDDGAEQRRAEVIASRMGISGPVTLENYDEDSRTTAGASRNSYAQLLSPENRRSTLLLWAMFFIVMFGFYFANTWTPQLLTEVGFSTEEGIFGGIMLMIGGTIGAVLYGVFASRWDVRRVQAVFAVASGVMFIVFISSTSWLPAALVAGVLLGLIINGCISGIYTIAPMTYTPRLRSTGVGVALGVGRTGAILAPIAVGALLDLGATPGILYIGAGVIVALAAVVVLPITLHQRTASEVRAEVAAGKD
ncbi:MFS transporter [Nesterenkonia sp. Act20]|uniref:MFS transporter n=1 Tax=Nesterenkonia sp. Act20 TaxID=1483432 RepID=UPI001C44D2C8|nr:MFS transporter [Nesterenkonia sp. Act20]